MGFNTNEMKFEASVFELDSSRDEIYEDLAHNLECEGIELQDYSEEFVMIVDENGYFKPLFPVFQIETKFGDIIELVGNIIFAKNIETESSTDIGGVSSEDILILKESLKIKLIGLTKGV